MDIKDSLIEEICTHHLVFYNRKDKTLLSIKGRVRRDETAVVIWPKEDMNLYGIDKMVCTNGVKAAREYVVIGMDRDQRIEAKNTPNRPHILFLSKNDLAKDGNSSGIKLKEKF